MQIVREVKVIILPTCVLLVGGCSGIRLTDDFVETAQSLGGGGSVSKYLIDQYGMIFKLYENISTYLVYIVS